MLSSQTLAIIRATRPILLVNGPQIFIRLHAILRPDTKLCTLFDFPHRIGVTAQYEFIDAIAARSASILPFSAPGVATRRPTAPQYDETLANALPHALRDTLGKAATREVIRAWTDAFGPNGLRLQRRCRFWKLWELLRQSEPNAFSGLRQG